MLAGWSEERRVRLQHIEPGTPVQNAYTESFDRGLREECLNANWFVSLADARRTIEAWRRDYNEERPHSSLGYIREKGILTTLGLLPYNSTWSLA